MKRAKINDDEDDEDRGDKLEKEYDELMEDNKKMPDYDDKEGGKMKKDDTDGTKQNSIKWKKKILSNITTKQYTAATRTTKVENKNKKQNQNNTKTKTKPIQMNKITKYYSYKSSIQNNQITNNKTTTFKTATTNNTNKYNNTINNTATLVLDHDSITIQKQNMTKTATKNVTIQKQQHITNITKQHISYQKQNNFNQQQYSKQNCKILLPCKALEPKIKNNTFQNNNTSKVTILPNKQALGDGHKRDNHLTKLEPNNTTTILVSPQNNKIIVMNDAEQPEKQNQFIMVKQLSVGTEEDLHNRDQN